MIADKSIKHNPKERIIESKAFLRKLVSTKKTAISRWTKELTSYKSLLKNRRNQFKTNLQINHRLRYFLLDSKNIENFEDEVVNFISDYLYKYHSKIKLHSRTPLFCIDTSNSDIIDDIESRLFSKGIEIETGYRGDKFSPKAFLREPKRVVKDNWLEFKLRLCQLGEDTIKAINSKKCDDLFIIGRFGKNKTDIQDLNVEYLDISNFNELKYLLLLKDSID